MIFQQTHELVMSGRKTQTRRIVKPGDTMYPFETATGPDRIQAVLTGGMDGRLKWVLYRTYAVQPGRGQKAVGRIRMTGIRREKLQDITWDDVLAEGIGAYTAAMGVLSDNPPDRRWKFMDLWNKAHGHDDPAYGDVEKLIGTPWDANPNVWVLEFELVEGGDG